MGVELPDIARHWSKRTEQGKAIRLDSAALDLLNAIGVGELIQTKAAEYQRDQCQKRAARNRSIDGGITGSTGGKGGPISKSFGTTQPESESEALARARLISGRGD